VYGARKRNLVILGCLAAAAAAVTAVTAFGVPVRSVLLFGMIALCPLMHLFMGHGHGGHTSTHAPEQPSGEEHD
jgi:hypothetical protein